MKNLTLFFLSFIFLSCSLLVEEDSNFNSENPYLGKEFVAFDNYYSFHNFYWKSSDTKDQVSLNKDGTIRVKYEDLKNNSKLRIEYNLGALRSKSEIYQEFQTDTIHYYNSNPLKDSIKIKSGLIDILDGRHIEYKYKAYLSYFWTDTNSNNQIKFFNDESIKVSYENSSLGKIRLDFDPDGELSRKSIIHQYFASDTSWQIDLETLEDSQIIKSGFTDYIDSVLFQKEYSPIIKGNYKKGVKVGKWIAINNKELIEIQYTKEGELDGNFKSYYYINETKGKLKKEGKYVHTNLKTVSENGQYTNIEESYNKLGNWKYYNQDGSLYKKVNY